MSIVYIDRKDGLKYKEKVYGSNFLNWLYGSKSGRLLTPLFVRRISSKIYGLLQDSSRSQKKIQPFINEFNIPIDDFESDLDQAESLIPFKTFNDFFVRKFKARKRLFSTKAQDFSAFAEGRYFAFNNVSDGFKIPIKGQSLDWKYLLGDDTSLAQEFEGGALFIARLNPTDYHRFNFPDNGRICKNYRIKGCLHSVNPIVFNYKPDVFLVNERHVSILETENFGKIAYIEVGAICVGRITQTFTQSNFSKGDEKGFFSFGGSSVLVLTQKNSIQISQDLLENTKKGYETLIKLGDTLATAR